MDVSTDVFGATCVTPPPHAYEKYAVAGSKS